MHSQSIIKNDKKLIHAWAMYDWANSVYLLVITSAIFPIYYNQVTRHDGSDLVELFGFTFQNSALYSITLGLSFGLIALFSPLLSSISDYSGSQKAFMRFFCYVGVIGCSLLFFFTGDNLLFGLGALMITSIGFSGSIVFYNSYLPEIASRDRMDIVSARGFSYGYAGASTLLIISLLFMFNKGLFGITNDTLAPRIIFLITALWWFSFAQIPFARLPRGFTRKTEGGNHYLLNGYKELLRVWNSVKGDKALLTFLGAFFFYTMGLQSAMYMAASFGEKEVKLELAELIFTILIIEYIGILGSLLFAKLSERNGNVFALIVAVTIWFFICLGSYFITTNIHFFTAAFFIGLVMGGIQTVSRSTYSKIIPKTLNNAGYFSFYDVSEKMAMMVGLILFGTLDNLTGSMRNSILALGVWFFIGLILLLRLRKIIQQD